MLCVSLVASEEEPNAQGGDSSRQRQERIVIVQRHGGIRLPIIARVGNARSLITGARQGGVGAGRRSVARPVELGDAQVEMLKSRVSHTQPSRWPDAYLVAVGRTKRLVHDAL